MPYRERLLEIDFDFTWDAAWLELPWPAWPDTLATLHMWTQIIGKLRLATGPPASHRWHAPLYSSASEVTAVDPQLGAGDERRGRAGQEGDRLSHLHWRT